MKVLMFSWEFPPRTIGGISPHVYHLSSELTELGVDTQVITCDFPGAKDMEEINGVRVHRVDSYNFPVSNFASWIYMMNLNLQMYATDIMRKEEVDLIHGHDWLVAEAVIGLKHIFRKPMLATIHSTEYGRRNQIRTPYQRMIHRTEAWLGHEAWRVVCCSEYMAAHVNEVLGISRTNIDVIPNGVDLSEFVEPYDIMGFRDLFADRSERIVLFVGRLVYEKGVMVLLDAAKTVLQNVNAKFIVVGDGYLKEELMKRTWDMGISEQIYFTGFLDVRTLRFLYRTADVCVVPSLYEPFGIVALEAMAAQTPVVVSGVGGLSEIVELDQTGVVVYPNDANSLAWGIQRALENESYARRITSRALKRAAKTYNWKSIAKKTLDLYERVCREYEKGDWKPT